MAALNSYKLSAKALLLLMSASCGDMDAVASVHTLTALWRPPAEGVDRGSPRGGTGDGFVPLALPLPSPSLHPSLCTRGCVVPLRGPAGWRSCM